MIGRARWMNIGYELLWYAVILGGGFAICYMILEQYSPIGDPDTVEHFLYGIAIMILTLCILSALWWRIANVSWEGLAFLRRTLEKHSFVCSVFPVITSFVVASLLYFLHGHLIYNMDMRHRYSLSCIYVLPLLFSSVMYAFPPVQIARVILPGKGYRILRVVVSLSFFFAAVYQFASNFFL